MSLRLAAVSLSCMLVAFVPAHAFDHSTWDALLKKRVVMREGGAVTQVDYTGMRAERAELRKYLRTTSAVTRAQFDAAAPREQLAFLINAYNAWTIELVLGGDPQLKSIRDLGTLVSSPWKKRFIPLLGETRSLDDIEHGMIRAEGRYEDPRIHFAVNCASIGCPALRPEAYTGARLDAQLEEATRLFLSDRRRNRLEGNTLRLSIIFAWYDEDFERGWRGYEAVTEFLAHYATALGLSEQQIASLKAGRIDIEYLDYDWRLNRTP